MARKYTEEEIMNSYLTIPEMEILKERFSRITRRVVENYYKNSKASMETKTTTAPTETPAFSNGLTLAQIERLSVLSEELGEAQQAIGKILRHGYESHNPDIKEESPSNRQNLEKELGHILAATKLLEDCPEKDLSSDQIKYACAHKLCNHKYLHHQDWRWRAPDWKPYYLSPPKPLTFKKEIK